MPVTKISGNAEIYGFDFKINYDRSALAFFGADENSDIFEIPGEYEWEYFTFRFVNNCEDCPSGLLQFVGIADQNDGIHNPLKMLLPDNTTLFTMDFLVTNDYTLEGQFLPVDFFWRDCTDNSIAAIKPGGTLYDLFMAVSRDIYSGPDGDKITNKMTNFPTFFGVPDECWNIQSNKKPIRYIDFYNGGGKNCRIRLYNRKSG